MFHTVRRTSGSLIGLCVALGFLVGGEASRATQAETCADGSDGVCLVGGRFRVEVAWVGSAAGDGAESQALGRDSAYFRSPAGEALIVALIDGRAVNGHFWMLSGALSDPHYSLTVTDLSSGASRQYNELQPASDLQAFAALADRTRGPQGAESAGLAFEGGRLRAAMEGMHARRLDAHNGYLWSEDPAQPDVVVSLVDGRPVGGERWLLVGSPSGAAGDLRIADAGARESLAVELAGGDSSIHVQALLGPRAVTVVLDRTRAASAIVPVAGATLTAKSANGTVFTLVVPAGALLSEEKITLTPVASIGGLPFRPGLVGAVHLEPEGLRLFQAATLRIKPPAAVPRAQEMTFAYRGLGKELFLFPPSVNAAGVEMKVLHFSGYGVAKGALAEQTAQLLRLPTRAEDRMSQKLQAIVSKKRRAGKSQAAAIPLDFAADIEQVLADTYKVSIKPFLTAVTTSCALLNKQEAIMLGWSRQVQLVLNEGAFAAEQAAIRDAWEKGLANCYDEAFGKCVNLHDPLQVTNMLAYLRKLQLLGADDQIDTERLDKCVRFDLNFETDTQYDTLAPNPFGVQAGYRMRLRAKVPLRFDLNGVSHVHGTALLAWESATWTGTLPPGVTVHEVGPGDASTLDVVELAFDLNIYEGPPPPPHIKLTYDPGSPTVTQIFDFDNDPEPVEFPAFQWRPPFYFLHVDEATAGIAGPLVARDWPLVGGAVWARKTYQRSKSVPNTFVASETTLLDLIHTPVP